MDTTLRVVGAKSLVLVLFGLVAGPAGAQAGGLWTEVTTEVGAFDATLTAATGLVKTYQLDETRLEARLAALPPSRYEAEGARSSLEMALPIVKSAHDDAFEDFVLEAVPVLDADLERRYPAIRTYVGWSPSRPGVRARVTVTPRGLHARIFHPDGVNVVKPADAGQGLHLAGPESAWRTGRRRAFETDIIEAPPLPRAEARDAAPTPRTTEGLRTYRLAVATTAGFARSLGGEVDRADVLGVVAAAVNGVDEIFERDLGVRLQLVSETDALIFLDPRDEPFAPADSDQLLEQSQVLFDCVVGRDGYDVGHTLNTLGWSVAMQGSVGRPGLKGMGTTGPTGTDGPGGNVFDLTYFAHELGHQFGAGHTFTGRLEECEKFYQETSAVEPGSGSTLMSYAGLCGDDDLEERYRDDGSDPYLHAYSIVQVLDYLRDSEACQPPPSDSGNRPPKIDAGTDFEVPRATRFWLAPASTDDPDGDALTFAWEQVDLGRQRRRQEPSCEAHYRSVPPTDHEATWREGLDPSTGDCHLEFAFTARDAGGGVVIDSKRVHVRRDVGPFTVSEPLQDSRHGNIVPVRWQPAGTDSVLGVAEVRLRLLCGDRVVADEVTANDGEHELRVPLSDDAECSNAALEVADENHLFFAHSPTFVLEPSAVHDGR